MTSHPTPVTWRATWLAAALSLAGCSAFLVDPCAVATAPDCPGTTTGLADMESSEPQKPLGPPRQFEWRAKVAVDSSKLKYVGMTGARPVFLRNGSVPSQISWAVMKFDWTASDENQRILTDMTPYGFPFAPQLADFVGSQVLVANSTLYLLSKTYSTVRYVDSSQEVVSGAKLAWPMTYFRHPELDVLAVNIQPTSGFSAEMIVGWNRKAAIKRQTNEAPPTSWVIGDLDASDRLKNGLEAISFHGFQVQPVLHQEKGLSSGLEDPVLQQGLQDAIEHISPGNTTQVDAAFIADLNLDGFVDFIYFRGGSLYVTSYRGRNPVGLAVFEKWSKVTFPAVVGESVQSVSAVDLTQDGYPELVIETDKAVHFYLNNP